MSRILRQEVTDVGHAEVDVAAFIGAGAAAKLGGDRIRSMGFDEAQQVEESAFAQNGKQE